MHAGFVDISACWVCGGTAFTRELSDAVSDLVARYHDAEAPSGRAYRLIVVAHPLPRAAAVTRDEEDA